MKMGKESWEGIHSCEKCGIRMEKKVFTIQGFKVRGWQCSKCRDEIYLGDELNKVLVYNKLKQGLMIKIGKLGNSLCMRFPNSVSSLFNIKKGKEVTLKVNAKNKLELEI